MKDGMGNSVEVTPKSYFYRNTETEIKKALKGKTNFWLKPRFWPELCVSAAQFSQHSMTKTAFFCRNTETGENRNTVPKLKLVPV